MEAKNVKGRFLYLNGDRLGQAGWKNFVLSSAFAAAAGTGLASYIMQDDAKLYGNPIIYTALVSCVLARTCNRTLFNPTLLATSGIHSIPPDGLIDTQPNTPQTPRQKEARKVYLEHAYKNGVVISATLTFASVTALTQDTIDATSAMTIIAGAAPFIAEGLGMIGRARSFNPKGWEIVSQRDVLAHMPKATHSPE